MVIKAPIEPLPDLAAFLAPFDHHFQRSEGRADLERYSIGQRSDLPRKNGDTIGAAVAGTNAQRIQELLTRIQWDASTFNAHRIETMHDAVRVGDGMLLFDDTGFAKQGAHSVGAARQYSGTWVRWATARWPSPVYMPIRPCRGRSMYGCLCRARGPSIRTAVPGPGCLKR